MANLTNDLTKLLTKVQLRRKTWFDAMTVARHTNKPFVFNVYINEAKGVAVIVDAKNYRVVKKTAKGDKFDAYTGVMLCLADYILELRYREAVKMTSHFTKATRGNDPALNLIVEMAKDVTLLERDAFVSALDTAKISADKDGKPIKHIKIALM